MSEPTGLLPRWIGVAARLLGPGRMKLATSLTVNFPCVSPEAVPP